MFTLQRTGSSVAGHLSNLGALLANSHRSVIVLQLQHQVRVQSNATANSAKHFAQSFISRKFVVTSTKSLAEALASSSFGASGATATTAKKRPTLPSNMVFRSQSHQHQLTAGHSTLAFDMASHADSFVMDTTASRPLVLLFAWMLSKNVHIEKYRQFWTDRGYDILTLQTSPMDLLFPKIGGRRNALNVFNFLSNLQPRYDQVLVHAFSVGGYQLCEFFYRMSEGCRNGEPEAIKLYQSLKGLVIDSCVFADDCAPGLSRAITHNKLAQPLIESSIANFLKVTRSFTLDRYYKVQAHLFANEMNLPGLLLFSKDDVVSNVQTNFQLGEAWKKKNVLTHIKCWDKSTHVLHYKENPAEYEYEVDKFLTKIDKITKAPKRKPLPPPSSVNQ